MTTYRFTGPTRTVVRKGICPVCGKRGKRQTTIEHTDNNSDLLTWRAHMAKPTRRTEAHGGGIPAPPKTHDGDWLILIDQDSEAALARQHPDDQWQPIQWQPDPDAPRGTRTDA